MSRYICVHGHFYQPPRENPWLELIEIQESAAPWHDWNERITAQCYRRNTASRILDGDGNIKKICNNYSRMSFNMGPTLLSWMKEKAPRCYKGVIEADGTIHVAMANGLDLVIHFPDDDGSNGDPDSGNSPGSICEERD